MDIRMAGLRDRRIAASDQSISVAGSEIYGRGTSARRAGGAAGARFDREPADITTIVLHQTAGAAIRAGAVISADDAIGSHHRIDRIAAHFIVTDDGWAIYLRDVQLVLSNAGGRRGIDIEFCGRFGNDPVPSGNRLSREAILCGRELVRALVEQIPSIRHIHPHGQVQQVMDDDERSFGPKYHSCSGPDIWVNVGEWALRTFGLSGSPAAGTYQDHGVSPRQSNPAYRQEV
jgi:hypothetical protein